MTDRISRGQFRHDAIDPKSAVIVNSSRISGYTLLDPSSTMVSTLAMDFDIERQRSFAGGNMGGRSKN